MADDDSLNITITADATSGATAVSDMESRLAALETQFNKTHSSSDSATSGFREFAEASGTGARALGVMGLEADAAAARIDGLVDVLERAGKAAPELLAIGAALAVVSAGFGFIKDGVASAGAFQTSMVALGTAVRLQGGDWDKTRESVEGYLETQERATGFDENEVLDAMKKLVVAGASYRDAQTEVAIAEDAARATGESLEEVINKIIEAESGRAQGLDRLDPKLRSLIKNHADLFQIMQQLEHDMGGQAAAAADTYEGSIARLTATWETFKKDVGTWLLPWLTDTVNGFIGLGDEIQDVVKDVEHLNAIKFVKDNITLDYADPSVRGRKIANDAQWERQHQLQRGLSRGTLDNNPQMGNGDGDSGDVPSITRADPDDSKYGFGKSDNATAMMKAFAQVEADLKSKVDDATTATQKQSAEMTLLAQKVNDTAAEENALKSIIGQDTAAKIAQNEATKASYTAYADAVTKLNEYKQSLAGQKETTETRTATQALQQTVDDLKEKWDKSKTTLDSLNSTLTAHKKLLGDVEEAAQKAGDAQAAANAKNALADDEYYTKAALQQSEFMATFEKTNAQKVAIYRAMTNAVEGDDAEAAERRRELTGKATEAWKAALDDQAKAYKKWVDEADKETASFIDSVISKHETLRDELKNIYDQILKNFSDTLGKELIAGGKSPLAALFPGNPLTSGGTGANQNTYTNGALNVYIKDHSSDALTKTIGSTTGVTTNSTMALLNTTPPAASSSGSGSSTSPTFLTTAVSGALQGAALGSSTSALTGDSGEDSQIGGALGGILGAALHANPLVGAGIDIFTSLIGGLLGPHETAADQPDLNDSNWGQDLANWQGGGVQVGGNFVTPGAQYNNSNGGSSQSIDIANWVQQNQNNLSTLTVAQQGIYSQMLALMGGNANAGAGAIGISSEHQGMVTLTDGQTMSVQNFEALVSNFNSTVGSGAGGSPVYSIGRSYPDFNIGSLTNTGGSTPSSGGTNTQVGNVTVVVQNPTIVGPSGLNDVAVAIGTAVQRTTSGTIPGSPSTYAGTGRNLRATAQGLG